MKLAGKLWMRCKSVDYSIIRVTSLDSLPPRTRETSLHRHAGGHLLYGFSLVNDIKYQQRSEDSFCKSNSLQQKSETSRPVCTSDLSLCENAKTCGEVAHDIISCHLLMA